MKQILSLVVVTSFMAINAASAMDPDRHSPADSKAGSASNVSSEAKSLGNYYVEMREQLDAKEIHDISTANELVRTMYLQAVDFGREVLTRKSSATVGEHQESRELNLEFKKRENGSCKYKATTIPSAYDPSVHYEGSEPLGGVKFEGIVKDGEQTFKIEYKMGITTGKIHWSAANSVISGPTFKVTNYSYTHVFPSGLTYVEHWHPEGQKIKWTFKNGSVKTGIVKNDGTFDFKIAFNEGSVLTCARDASGDETWEFKHPDGRIKKGCSKEGSVVHFEEALSGERTGKAKVKISSTNTAKVTRKVVSNVDGKVLGVAKEISYFCAGCEKVSEDDTFKKCSGCKSVRYCSRECQVAHWKVHKATCKAKQAEAAQSNRTAGSGTTLD